MSMVLDVVSVEIARRLAVSTARDEEMGFGRDFPVATLMKTASRYEF